MTLGEKIKKIRKAKGLTQTELAGEKITRNMLSVIESDKALPSLDTLFYISSRLGVCASYFVFEEDELFLFEKNALIEEIKALFLNGEFKKCLDKIKQIEKNDDELNYIAAYCCFELGKKFVLCGSLKSGEEYLSLCQEFSSKTIYDTSKIENSMLIYSALSKNIQAPLLELDTDSFEGRIDGEFEFEFYKYLIGDMSFKFKNPVFKNHLNAKAFIKERKYNEALTLLRLIEDEKTPDSYNAYVIFAVYSDMEGCYKQLADFENAYRYASKRLSIIEGFKS